MEVFLPNSNHPAHTEWNESRGVLGMTVHVDFSPADGRPAQMKVHEGISGQSENGNFSSEPTPQQLVKAIVQAEGKWPQKENWICRKK